MKNTPMLIALAFLGCTAVATAQTTTHHHKAKTVTVKTVTPPDAVLTSYNSKFSGDTAAWSVTPSGNFCATTMVNGQKEYAEFDSTGGWLRNRTDMTADQLPGGAKTAIQTKYPGMEIASVQKLEYNNVNPFYKVDLKQGDQAKEVMVNDAGYVQE
ncbi:MAG TPA: PepSY-like domain-containing protein [Dinghuibacter sp.]|uniref:PepSY-like domain-containing protein n=1 Tax=Dinghuibacter sp. TaxID=2024697 RepID=UPI002D05CCAB|nr:PepSY-like domain-containing protein [Dinghuibacter sp.]HTJ10743.1 PepSY-like domain-containing protein [Dinghuibacter sp.]